MNFYLLKRKTQEYLDHFYNEVDPSDEGFKLLILGIRQIKSQKTQSIIAELYKQLSVQQTVQQAVKHNIEKISKENRSLESLLNHSKELKITQKDKCNEIVNTMAFLKDNSHLPWEKWANYLSGKDNNVDNLFDDVNEKDRNVENKFINAIKELLMIDKYRYEVTTCNVEQILNETIDNPKDNTIDVESLSIEEILHYLEVISCFYQLPLNVPWHIEFNMDFVWCKLMCKATAHITQAPSQLRKDFTSKKRTTSSTKAVKAKSAKIKQGILSLQKNIIKADPHWLGKTELEDRIKYYWSSLKDKGGYPTKQTIRKHLKEIEKQKIK
jgi:hypothetical protein